MEYTYDAWGKLLSTTGSLAGTIGKVNPFLYRGYYYDSETGLYYLNSRYYDPQTGRFINADDAETLQTSQGNILEANLFAYCGNNPVNYIDPTGTNAVAIVVSSSVLADFIAWLEIIAVADWWNPVGWIIGGVIVVGAITWVAVVGK